MDELRRTADTRPGYATYPDSRPGTPSWWQRHGQQPPARPAPAARPWTGPEPLMAFGPPMILAPVNEHDDQDDEQLAATIDAAAEQAAAEVRAAIDALGLTDPVVKVGPTVETIHAPEPRRWWHRITRGTA